MRHVDGVIAGADHVSEVWRDQPGRGFVPIAPPHRGPLLRIAVPDDGSTESA